MNSDLLFDGKTYISVGRASKKLGYTADYIGQLCRAGKIDAKMIGRTWYVEWESLKNHKKSKKNRVRRTAEEIRQDRVARLGQTVYVLDEELDANTEHPISNGVKNYKLPTVNEDCPPDEYLGKIDAQNTFDEKTNASISPVVAIPVSSEVISTPVLNENHYPPQDYLNKIDDQNNTSLISEEWLPKLVKKDTSVVSPYVFSPRSPSGPLVLNNSSRYANKIAVTLSLLVVITTASSWIGFENPKLASEKIIPALHNIQNEVGVFLNPNGNQLASVSTSDSDTTTNLSSVIGSLENGISYFFSGLKTKINNYAVSYMKSLGFVPAGSTPPTNTNGNSGQIGLVVVPDDPNHDATVATIKNSFSDKVDVKVDQDPTSGVIIPQFKTTKDTAYTYVMVPINSP